jgi:hypothetical protein
MKTTTQEEYVKACGLQCPACKSKELQCDTPQQDGAVIHQNIDCLSCGAYWTDLYTLSGFSNFHEKDIEETCPLKENT